MTMQVYHGSCHCGAVAFEIDADISILGICTCSICTKKGCYNFTVPPERLRLVRGEEKLKIYQFNTKIAKHYFCPHCGIHTFSNPRTAPDKYNINIRCLDDFDIHKAVFGIRHFDGRDWESAFEKYQADQSQ